MMMIAIFWLSLFAVGYAYAGYPLLLKLLTAARAAFSQADSPSTNEMGASGESTATATGAVSIILVAYNEAERIEARIRNLAGCVYARDRELIVVCGGCTDDTADRARRWRGPMEVRVIETEERQSKAAGLNRGVAEARHELVIFVDARQAFHTEALQKLVAPFSEPAVAAVSGNLEIAPSEDGTGAGIDAYWRYERWIRAMESEWDSVIGCTGAIYALRRECFEPLPEDTILDDVVIPMQALVAGRRVVFEKEAVAFDPQHLSPEKERRRKIRTLAGNYQMLFRYPGWLSPFRNRAWWQLVSHKYLRLAGPFLLVACLITSGWLARDHLFYRVAFGIQLGCYALAGFGMLFRGIRSPLVTAPAGFLFLQWQGLRALFHYLRLRRSPQAGVWS